MFTEKYTPKEYEIVIVEIIRENGETIVDTAIGPNSISRVVFDHFGTDFIIGQYRHNHDLFLIDDKRGIKNSENVSVNLISTKMFAKFDYELKLWIVSGKHSGKYSSSTFKQFMKNLSITPCQN